MDPRMAGMMTAKMGQNGGRMAGGQMQGVPAGAAGAQGAQVNPMVVALLRALMQGQQAQGGRMPQGGGMPQQGPVVPGGGMPQQGPVVPGGGMPQRGAMPMAMPGQGGGAGMPQGGQMNPLVAALMARAAGQG